MNWSLMFKSLKYLVLIDYWKFGKWSNMLLIQTWLLFFFSHGVLRVAYSTHVVNSELKSMSVVQQAMQSNDFKHILGPTKYLIACDLPSITWGFTSGAWLFIVPCSQAQATGLFMHSWMSMGFLLSDQITKLKSFLV